jgi:hypothetical protein
MWQTGTVIAKVTTRKRYNLQPTYPTRDRRGHGSDGLANGTQRA